MPSRPSKDVLNTLAMNESQCIGTFPGLFKDIDSTVALGSFALNPAGDLGPLQVKLKDGQVRFLNLPCRCFGARSNCRILIMRTNQLYILNPERKEPLSPELLDVRNGTQASHIQTSSSR